MATLTVDELRELAEGGDHEAAEELEAIEAAEAEEADEHARTVADELLEFAESPDDLAPEVPGYPGPRGHETIIPAEGQNEPFTPRAGDEVLVVAEVEGETFGVIRLANGRGVITLEDGRQLVRGQYALALG